MYHVIHCTHVCLLLANCWYLPSALTVSRQTWHVTWPFYPEYCAWKRQNCQVWQLDRFLGKTCSYNLHYYIAEWELTTCCVLAMFHFRVFLRSFHSKKKKRERPVIFRIYQPPAFPDSSVQSTGRFRISWQCWTLLFFFLAYREESVPETLSCVVFILYFLLKKNPKYVVYQYLK